MRKSLVALVALAAVEGSALADVTLPSSSEPNTNSGWFATVDTTLDEQPHWVCPLVTVFPQLVEEYRYDEIVQNKVRGNTLINSGGGVRGLELIPSEHVEILIGQPGYMNLQTPKTTTSGWTDETLLMKYRLLAANEENGNYIVSGFMAVSIPTGSVPFTQNATVATPTLAVGKGWGTRWQGVDVISTLSESIPSANQNYLGEPIVWNTALQGHLSDYLYLWPEIETSLTRWRGGLFAGKDQLIVIYGINFARFPLGGRSKLTVGVGYQTANMSGFSTFGSGWVSTVRLIY